MLCESVEQANSQGYDEGEGTERQSVIRALFKDDRRLQEARDLLATHKPRIVSLAQDPGLPDSEYLEKQKSWFPGSPLELWLSQQEEDCSITAYAFLSSLKNSILVVST